METVALLISLGALVVLAVLVGRLMVTLLKIALVGVVLYLTYVVVYHPGALCGSHVVQNLALLRSACTLH
jgi:hypothetical protein